MNTETTLRRLLAPANIGYDSETQTLRHAPSFLDDVFQPPVLESMSPELLDILVCPRSKNKLHQADTAILAQVNALIERGACKEISGAAVSEKASEGLFEPTTKVFYFVRDGIPVLIFENGVNLSQG